MHVFYKGFRWGLKVGVLFSIAFILIALLVIFKQKYDASNSLSELEQIDTLLEPPLYTLEGELYDLAQSNQSLYLVNLWGTWCAPCIAEFPLLEEIYKSVNQSCRFLMISDEDQKTLQAFVEKNNYSFTFIRSEKKLLGKVVGFPTTLLVDADGDVLYTHTGAFNESSIKTLKQKIRDYSVD